MKACYKCAVAFKINSEICKECIKRTYHNSFLPTDKRNWEERIAEARENDNLWGRKKKNEN